MSAGVAATAVGVATLSGQVAAHFPAGLELDIKPGSEDNPINTNNHGVIPVAVLQTDEFDPTGADVRYRFGAPDVVSAGDGARPAHAATSRTWTGTDGRMSSFTSRPTGPDSTAMNREAGSNGSETSQVSTGCPEPIPSLSLTRALSRWCDGDSATGPTTVSLKSVTPGRADVLVSPPVLDGYGYPGQEGRDCRGRQHPPDDDRLGRGDVDRARRRTATSRCHPGHRTAASCSR